MVSEANMDLLKSGTHPCAVCFTGTGSNAILCGGCSLWVHTKNEVASRHHFAPTQTTSMLAVWAQRVLLTEDQWKW